MGLTSRRSIAGFAVASLVAAACQGATPGATGTRTGAPTGTSGGASAGTSGAASAGTTGAASAGTGLPYSATLKDGSTFTLAPRIADKVRAKQAINYVLSYQSPSIALFSPQYQAGYDESLPRATATYPMNAKIIAPVSESGVDVPAQIAQIEALDNTEQIDCLSIEPPDSNAFTAITNRLMAKGIPVFTVGVTSNGNEFTNFTQLPEKEGAQAAQIVLDWASKNGKQLDSFAVSGGDPTAFWAQGRMKSFRETIQKALPNAKFINTETNALATTFEPGKAYDAFKAFIEGHPDVDFIENVDISAEHAARAIKDAGKAGKINVIGWNVSTGQLDAIEEGTQVAALDQKWSEQAGFGALACAELFANGKILPNTQQLQPVTKENVAQARADLQKILDRPSPSP